MINLKEVQMPNNPDDGVKELFEKIERGIKARRVEEGRWTVNEDYEDMKQWSQGDEMVEGAGDQITVNKVGSYIRDYRAQISFNEPRVKLRPKNSDGWEPMPVPVVGPDGTPKTDPNTGEIMVREVLKSKVRENLLNGIISQPLFGMQATGSRLIKAGCMAWGCLKTGYRPSFETAPEPEGEQVIPIKDGKLDTSGFAKNQVTGSLIKSDRSDRLISRSEIPTYEDWFISWVPYRNMIIDPDGGNDWRDHDWVAEEIVRSLDEVKEDPLFDKAALKDLGENGTYFRDENDGLKWDATPREWSRERDPDNVDREKVVRLFEVYDMVNERLIVLADGHGKMLRDDAVPAGITDHPYSDFRPNEILGKFYPRPIVTDLIPPCTAYNEMRRQEHIAGKNSTRKILIREGAMDNLDLERFTSDEDNEVIFVKFKAGHSTFQDNIMPWTPAPMNDAIYRNAQMTSYDFDEIGGMSQASRGGGGAETATETSVIEQHATIRIKHDRKTLAETYRRIFKKLNDSIDANMTVARAVQLEGSDGQAFTGLVDQDLIAGDYDVDVDFEDMAPVDEMAQLAHLNSMLQVMGQAHWLFADEVTTREFMTRVGIKNERVVQAIAQRAEFQVQLEMMQAQAMMMSKVPQENPESGAPKSTADNAKKTAAGKQSPRMSAAS